MSKPATIHTLESLKARCVEEGDCWLWQGSIKNKAPSVYHEGRMMSVRAVVQQLRGKPTAGRFLSCNCGEYRCIKPDHILARVPAVHMAHLNARANEGMARVIRMRKLTETKRRTSAKLTMEQAREIRESTEGPAALKRKYGVDRSLISRIKGGKAWREHSSPFAGLMR